jgi:hypothetical protein
MVKKNRLSNTLRRAIDTEQVKGITPYRIATVSGIPYLSILRLMNGELSMPLDELERLAQYLGLRIVRAPNGLNRPGMVSC